MLKHAFKIVIISCVIGCTPIPLGSSTPTQSLRPVPPLPVETMVPKITSPSSPIVNRPNTAKSGSSPKSLTPLSATAVTTLLEQAEDRAISATNLGQSAQTKEDWQLVLSQWQRAIALLRQIPATSPQKARIQQRLAEYQSNLAQAKQRSTTPSQLVNPAPELRSSGRTIPLIVSPKAPTSSPSPLVSPTAAPDSNASPTSSGNPLPPPGPSKTP